MKREQGFDPLMLKKFDSEPPVRTAEKKYDVYPKINLDGDMDDKKTSFKRFDYRRQESRSSEKKLGSHDSSKSGAISSYQTSEPSTKI